MAAPNESPLLVGRPFIETPNTGPNSRLGFNPRAEWCLELAKLHTALAHVAATAQASDGREWVRVAGPWFSDISLALHEQDVGSVSAK